MVAGLKRVAPFCLLLCALPYFLFYDKEELNKVDFLTVDEAWPEGKTIICQNVL